MPRARAINIGEARKLSDRQLVNGLVCDLTSAAVYRRVIDERLRKDGYSELFFWTLDADDPRPPKASPKKLDPLRDWIVTAANDYLDAELRDYLRRYPFFDDEYDPLDEPARCREFCQDKGKRSGDNVYGCSVTDLSSGQYKMLLAIRGHAKNWLKHERTKIRKASR